jgi:xylose isomerase
MDAFARALLAAQAILDHGEYTAMRKERYASFDSGKGKQFAQGKVTLEALRDLAHKNGEPEQRSGKQEYFENLLSRFV